MMTSTMSSMMAPARLILALTRVAATANCLGDTEQVLAEGRRTIDEDPLTSKRHR